MGDYGVEGGRHRNLAVWVGVPLAALVAALIGVYVAYRLLGW